MLLLHFLSGHRDIDQIAKGLDGHRVIIYVRRESQDHRSRADVCPVNNLATSFISENRRFKKEKTNTNLRRNVTIREPIT